MECDAGVTSELAAAADDDTGDSSLLSWGFVASALGAGVVTVSAVVFTVLVMLLSAAPAVVTSPDCTSWACTGTHMYSYTRTLVFEVTMARVVEWLSDGSLGW